MSTTLAPASSPTISFAQPTVETRPDPPAAPGGACDVCGHPVSGHDTIANRYCSATQANALTRGCICPTSKS